MPGKAALDVRAMCRLTKSPGYPQRKGFLGDSVIKNPPGNAGGTGLIPVLGRSSKEGKGDPLQSPIHYTVHGVAKSQTQLSDFHFHFHIYTCM